MQSVAVVPVGLTKFRKDLFPLQSYDQDSAEDVVRIMERYGDNFQAKYGQRICYAADEFYLKAHREIPPAEFYGDFDQLENGVGLMANLKQEFEQALEDFDPPKEKRHVTLITGMALYPFLNDLLDGLRIKCNNLTCELIPIVNDFFGHAIDVAGLVTGGDIIKQLKGRNLGSELILPNVMLRHEADVFLDDVTVDELKEALQTNITVIPNDGYELLNAIIGSDASV